MSFHSTVAEPFEPNRSVRPQSGAPGDEIRPALDDLSLRFVRFAQRAHGDVLDFGCGGGSAAVSAVMGGAHVYAVDSEPANIQHLLAQIPPDKAPHLKVRIGSLPGANFRFPRFSAIHSSRVLHRLDPLAVRRSLQKFFHWLEPNGKLFLSTEPTHRLPESILRQELEAAGFRIELMYSYPLPGDGGQMCCGVVASCKGTLSEHAECNS